MNLEENIIKAREAITDAQAILISAGAGLGVDSGLPDFRGNEGFWQAYPPIAKLGLSFSEMANPLWFAKKPKLAWAFYGHRLNLYRKTIPHAGFSQLLELGNKMEFSYFIFTSNVDGQFQTAGFDADRIEECHGSIHHLQCTLPCHDDIWSANDLNVNVDEDIFEATSNLPVCPACGLLARPNILMFGDWSWISQRSEQQHSKLKSWLARLIDNQAKLVVIEIGAGEVVATVRETSESMAENGKATLIRINPRNYEVPTGQISIPMGALEGISKIL